MIEISDKKKCCGCTACANICPQKAIKMEYDSEGFMYPTFDINKCTNCGMCDRICPVINKFNIKEKENFPIVYACYNINNEIRKKSSSGGIFYLLAKEVLKNGGIVVGASYDDDFSICHRIIYNKDELEKLMGSKYAQSEMRNIYRLVRENLIKGKKVLFSGTSCQVAGLKKFLIKEYDNLLCVDLICMGIPSNKIWKDYICNFYNKGKIKSINFKDKTYGWDCFSVKVLYEKGEDIQVGRLNNYMQLFFKGINIRPICFECPFRGKNRISDFTLSDCWGINNFAKELNDNLGTSSVMIHSEKGNKIFESLKDELKYKQITFEEATKNNIYALKTVKPNDERKKFFSEYKSNGTNFKRLIKKYARVSIKYKIRIKISQFKRIFLGGVNENFNHWRNRNIK